MTDMEEWDGIWYAKYELKQKKRNRCFFIALYTAVLGTLTGLLIGGLLVWN